MEFSRRVDVTNNSGLIEKKSLFVKQEVFASQQKVKEEIAVSNLVETKDEYQLSVDPESINKMNVALNGFHIEFIKAICAASPELQETYEKIYKGTKINWKVKGSNVTVPLNGEELCQLAVTGLTKFAQVKNIE